MVGKRSQYKKHGLAALDRATRTAREWQIQEDRALKSKMLVAEQESEQPVTVADTGGGILLKALYLIG